MQARGGATLILGTLLTLSGPPVVAAQQQEAADPPYERVLISTGIGAVLGVALLAGPPTVLAHVLGDPNETVPASGIAFLLTAPVGWWLGQSMGASRSTRKGERAVSTRSLLAPAALWTIGGFALGGWMGESEGFLLGMTTGLAGTAWSAYRKSRAPR